MTETILGDRAQKYGRNVMAAAGAILALAWLPGIGIEQFKFFGLEFNKASGSQFSFWCLMTVVLVYFAVRYWIEARIDYLARYRKINLKINRLPNYREQLRKSDRPGSTEELIQEMLPVEMEIRKFWIIEISLPLFLVIAAVASAHINIEIYWP